MISADDKIEIFQLIVAKEYRQALVLLDAMIARDGASEEWLRLKARCLLGLDDFDAASELYNRMLEKGAACSAAARGEAALLLGQNSAACTFFEQAGAANLGDDGLLLAAAGSYLSGRIVTCIHYLGVYFKSGADWDEDDPIDLVLQQVLARHEFYDFEQIYLDVQESVLESVENPRNRWFSINIPVYELYTASTPAKQRQRAQALAAILSPQQKIEFSGATQQLQKILQDFAASEEDARFGLESLKLLHESNWSELAKLVLAMQLEHLKEFSERFALTQERIAQSSLQQIIPLLPLRLAMALMVLYAIADSEDRLLQRMVQEIEGDILAGLIQLAFQAFYVEIDRAGGV